MRKVFILAVVAAASWGGVAHADQAGWCAAYARDFADARATDKVLWQHKYDIAQKSCLDRELPSAPVAEAKKADVPKPNASATEIPKPLPKAVAAVSAEPVVADVPMADAPTKPKRKVASSAPEVGSDEWNTYCAKKYTSFNAATGTYKSLTGVERKCLYTG